MNKHKAMIKRALFRAQDGQLYCADHVPDKMYVGRVESGQTEPCVTCQQRGVARNGRRYDFYTANGLRQLGTILRTKRRQAGLTQLQLASQLGVSRGYVSVIEAGVERHGKRPLRPSRRNLLLWMDAVGVKTQKEREQLLRLAGHEIEVSTEASSDPAVLAS